MSIDAIIVKFPTTISGAILVIAGMYGNGEERKTALKKMGLMWMQYKKLSMIYYQFLINTRSDST